MKTLITIDGKKTRLTNKQHAAGLAALDGPRTSFFRVESALLEAGVFAAAGFHDSLSPAGIATTALLEAECAKQARVTSYSKAELAAMSPLRKLELANTGRFRVNDEGGLIAKSLDNLTPREPTPLASVQIVVVARNAIHARRLRRAGLAG